MYSSYQYCTMYCLVPMYVYGTQLATSYNLQQIVDPCTAYSGCLLPTVASCSLYQLLCSCTYIRLQHMYYLLYSLLLQLDSNGTTTTRYSCIMYFYSKQYCCSSSSRQMVVVVVVVEQQQQVVVVATVSQQQQQLYVCCIAYTYT